MKSNLNTHLEKQKRKRTPQGSKSGTDCLLGKGYTVENHIIRILASKKRFQSRLELVLLESALVTSFLPRHDQVIKLILSLYQVLGTTHVQHGSSHNNLSKIKISARGTEWGKGMQKHEWVGPTTFKLLRTTNSFIQSSFVMKGIPHFIVLHFIALCRYCIFKIF